MREVGIGGKEWQSAARGRRNKLITEERPKCKRKIGSNKVSINN